MILKEGLAKGYSINKNKLISQHYYSIVSTATLLLPTVLGLPEEKFHDQFSMPRSDAAAARFGLNAEQTMQLGPRQRQQELRQVWRRLLLW